MNLRWLVLIAATNSGCAAMIQQWVSSHCYYEAAYADGSNRQKTGAPPDTSGYSQYCPPQSLDASLRGYREGFDASARAQAEADAQAQAQAQAAAAAQAQAAAAAQAQAMAAWAAANCSYDATYAQGMNVQRTGGTLDPSIYGPCPVEMREGAMRGYRMGYEAALRDTQPRGVVVGPPPVFVPPPRPVVVPPPPSPVPPPPGPVVVAPPPPNPRAFYCSVMAFNNKFEAFGPTQLEAKQATQAACMRSYNEMFCREIACQVNR